MKTAASKGISYCILTMNKSASKGFMHFEAEIFMGKYTIAYMNNLI